MISKTKKTDSQIEVDQTVISFLGDLKIENPEDLVVLKNLILRKLKFRSYNSKTKKHADGIQWRRTASEIIKDGYVYEGKACSDLAVVFLALCKVNKIEGQLVKLITVDGTDSHSIVEIKLNKKWFRIDPSSNDSVSFEGRLNNESIWNKKYKIWRKGRDVWDLGLCDISAESKISNKQL